MNLKPDGISFYNKGALVQLRITSVFKVWLIVFYFVVVFLSFISICPIMDCVYILCGCGKALEHYVRALHMFLDHSTTKMHEAVQGGLD